jgi:nucleotide-binding universal stress UspA family protein
VLIAKQFGAALHVLHVVENASAVLTDGLPFLPPDFFDEMEKDAAEKLERVIAHDKREKLAVTLIMRRGAAFVEIVEYVKEQQIDLIIPGTHGRGAIAHSLMGSIAEKVVRKTSCPVLTIGHPAHHFVMP